MPDNSKLISQLANLERRTARGGRDSVDHPPNSHDDIANVAMGVATLFVSGDTGYSMEIWRKVAGLENEPLDDPIETLLDRSRRLYARTGSFAVPIGDGGLWVPPIAMQWQLAAEAAAQARREAAEKRRPAAGDHR
jgi:hypothetical protein